MNQGKKTIVLTWNGKHIAEYEVSNSIMEFKLAVPEYLPPSVLFSIKINSPFPSREIGLYLLVFTFEKCEVLSNQTKEIFEFRGVQPSGENKFNPSKRENQ